MLQIMSCASGKFFRNDNDNRPHDPLERAFAEEQMLFFLPFFQTLLPVFGANPCLFRYLNFLPIDKKLHSR